MTQFNYANMTFSDIMSQIQARLANDPKFANFSESAIAQTILEIFAGVNDMTNYYIERRAEETFLDTARLQSSVVGLTKSIGYVPVRPIPAKANIKIILKGPLPLTLSAGDIIGFDSNQINLSYNGFNFIFTKTYEYLVTSDDIAQGVGNKDFRKEIEYSVKDLNTITINDSGNVNTNDPAVSKINSTQGTKIVYTIAGSDYTSKVAKIFQTYSINDTTFSNLYGQEDISYDYETDTYALDNGLTKVGIGDTSAIALSGTNLYEIARQSILTARTTLDSVKPNVCLIESNPDQTIKLSFSDGIIATLGLVDQSQSIFIQYLQTKGSSANKIGVKGDKLSTSNTFITTNTMTDVTNNIEFRFNGNIIGGADFESIASMKQNAPGIYAALDRLTTKQDYLSYLRSLTSPIDVRNALAWGEQEEINIRGMIANKELFNVILYCVLGSLYDFSKTEFGVRQISATGVLPPETLFTNYWFGAGYDYYDLNKDALNTIGAQESLSTDDPLTIVNTKLNRKGQMTTRAFSLQPIIQYFNLSGRVYVNKLYSLSDTRKKINNALYTYFDTNADFNEPIYKSSIVSLIESYPEVNFCDIKFTAMDLGNNAPIISSAGSSACAPLVDGVTFGLLTTAQQALLGSTLDTVTKSWLTNASTTTTSAQIKDFDIRTYYEELTRKPGGLGTSGISEEQFWNTLAPNLFSSAISLYPWAINWAQAITTSASSTLTNFDKYLRILNTTLKDILVTNIIDDSGNIITYTLKQEVPAINISDPVNGLIYTYR